MLTVLPRTIPCHNSNIDTIYRQKVLASLTLDMIFLRIQIPKLHILPVGGTRKGSELGFLNMFKMCVSTKTRSNILKSPSLCIRTYRPLPSIVLHREPNTPILHSISQTLRVCVNHVLFSHFLLANGYSEVEQSSRPSIPKLSQSLTVGVTDLDTESHSFSNSGTTHQYQHITCISARNLEMLPGVLTPNTKYSFVLGRWPRFLSVFWDAR